MVLLDADVIVTRPLGELIERAAADRLVAFRNDRPRFFAEWAELLELPDLAPAPYVSSSAVFVGGGPADRVLPLAHERQLRVDPDRTWVGGGIGERPALLPRPGRAQRRRRLAAERGEVVALEHRLAPSPPFKGLRVRDEAGLRCAYRDRTEPFLLHHWSLKPWLVPVRRNAYTRLLTRLLLGPDVPVRFPGRAAAAPAANRDRGGGGASSARPHARSAGDPPQVEARARRGHRVAEPASERSMSGAVPRPDPRDGSRPPRVMLGAVGWAGHAFPVLALARDLRRQGHEVLVETFERWRGAVEEIGAGFAPADEQMVFGGSATPPAARRLPRRRARSCRR